MQSRARLTLDAGRNEETRPEASNAEVEVKRQHNGDRNPDKPVVHCVRTCVVVGEFMGGSSTSKAPNWQRCDLGFADSVAT